MRRDLHAAGCADMKDKHYMNTTELAERARSVARLIEAHARLEKFPALRPVVLYGIPRGGVPAALAVIAHNETPRKFVLTSMPENADVFVDDIVDTGATRDAWRTRFRDKPFTALVDVQTERKHPGWIVFPWEGDAEGSFADNITRLLQFVGEDPTRGGLQETPARVVRAWEQWTAGYHINPADVLKTFEDGAEKCDEMVVIEHIPVYSHCEHHLAPIFGHATVAYIPDAHIVGLSKINRVVDIFARRLQVQERMTNQIADAIMEHLKPHGCGVVIRARHFCMESRGVKQNSTTTTSALRGVFTDGIVRAEFLSLARNDHGSA